MTRPNNPQENQFPELIGELEVARLSQPSDKQLLQYKGLHHHVQSTSLIAELIGQIQAALTWDSRQQPLLQGARNAGERSYRLLYTAEQAEVEMMVEPVGEHRHIEGDILVSEEGDLLPALVTLEKIATATVEAAVDTICNETECDENGRFSFDSIEGGDYHMSITLADGALISIDTLKIS